MGLQDNFVLDVRLSNHGIFGTATPTEVVSNLGAMQAQDYQSALWAIGLRCKNGITKSDVEDAISKHKIVRTWLMRGTLHFASALDVKWMLKLFAPRLRNTALKRDNNLGLNNKIIEKTKSLFSKALHTNKQLSRPEMYKIMKGAGVPTTNNIGYHMLYRAAWDGLICFGPWEGKQPTFVLLDEWLKGYADSFTKDKALAELATRYFLSHGPATVSDYVWWSGLRVSDAKIGIAASKQIKEMEINGKHYYMPKKSRKPQTHQNNVHLLPAFDEYVVSYADRSLLLDNPNTSRSKSSKPFVHSNGVFRPTLVIDGRVAGIWKQSKAKNKVVIQVTPFQKLSHKHMNAIEEAVCKYGEFLECGAILDKTKL